MLNPVNHAVQEIQYTIPSQILTEVFGREDYRNWRRTAPVSIDEMIKSKVIRPRVLKDCNLLGGRQIYVSLEGLRSHQQDTYTVIYDIPPERTGNREIISVLSANYLPHSAAMGAMGMAYGSVNPITQSDLEAASQRVIDSYANVPHISTAHVELIGYNTILVRDQMRSTLIYEIRCIVANEENLSNISPRSYPAFAQACIYATESYIYNQLIIRMDQGMLEQGQPLGEFKNYVDRFVDSEEKYRTYINEQLRKVLFMSDVMSHTRFITAQINPGI